MVRRRNYLIPLALAGSLLLVAACKRGDEAQKAGQQGYVQVATGTVELVRAGQSSPLKKGDTLAQGDTVRTGGDGLVILALYGDRGAVEVQENAIFTLKSLGAEGELGLDKGNAWVRMTKLQQGESLRVVTPTAIAGVRGTKFYNFTMPDGTTGICQCEGSVNYSRTTGFERVHEQDSVVLTRGEQTVVLTMDDLRAAGLGDIGHDHSTIPDSSLGPQNKRTPEQNVAMMTMINKKFAEAGAK